MLDNGAYEGKAVPFSVLLKLAREMNVHEIVIPDVMGDAKLTLRNAKRLIDKVPSRYRIAIVPQGKDIPEFIDCFKKMLKLKPNTICFPKWLGLSRPLVVNYLMKKDLLRGIGQFHLLGLDNICEFFGYRPESLYYIRSVDTSKPFTFARYGKILKVFEAQHYDRVPMDVPEFSPERKELVVKNMRVILNVARML